MAEATGYAAVAINWLRDMARRGGKGTVSNIDARGLGRVADELERLSTALAAAERERDEARMKERERCAGLARDACLVPPDGGSMTEDERRICEDLAAAIMRDPDKLPWDDTPEQSR